jgi:biopolymer transport protein ExbD
MALNVGEGRGGAIAAINVTPMADVMIVLLIIFMVTTPFIQNDGMKLPAAEHARKQEEADALIVTLAEPAAIRIAGRPIEGREAALAAMRERLEAIPEGRRLVVLKAEEDVDYGAIEGVLDLCRQAGAEEIALATRAQAGG